MRAEMLLVASMSVLSRFGVITGISLYYTRFVSRDGPLARTEEYILCAQRGFPDFPNGLFRNTVKAFPRDRALSLSNAFAYPSVSDGLFRPYDIDFLCA